ncbi:MAG: flippase-like domain-containing protein [Planctomycetaceae bacterium]|nr:flippase-like domain-containing protein [Planctomycetaceae bacterium]
MKRLVISFVKIALSLAILAFLVWNSTRGEKNVNAFANLRDRPKDWAMLAAAWVCCTAAVLVTFVRWWYLVRALDIPCRFRDAIRISFWGYLFNLAPLGIVAGDLVKAVMLDHEHRGYRAKAVASVFVDRVIGLWVLFIVASVAILLTGFWRINDPLIWWVCKLTFVLTIAGTIALAALLGPDYSDGKITRMFGRIPKIGPPLESLIVALRMYQHRPAVLVGSSLATVAVHSLFATGCWFIACGLPGNHLSLGQHFVVMPLASAMGVIPLAMGPLEATLDFLYAHVPVAGEAIAAGQGLVVALAYRLITVVTAVLGLPYYFSNRREMSEVIHEAEQEQAPSATTAQPV